MFSMVKAGVEYHPRGSGPTMEVMFTQLIKAADEIKKVHPANKIQFAWDPEDVTTDFYFWVNTDPDDETYCNIIENMKSGVVKHPIKDWWREYGRSTWCPWTPSSLKIRQDLGLNRGKMPEWEEDKESWDKLKKWDIVFDRVLKDGLFDRLPERDVWNFVSNEVDAGWVWE